MTRAHALAHAHSHTNKHAHANDHHQHNHTQVAIDYLSVNKGAAPIVFEMTLGQVPRPSRRTLLPRSDATL